MPTPLSCILSMVRSEEADTGAAVLCSQYGFGKLGDAGRAAAE